jgi:hypothetical protein
MAMETNGYRKAARRISARNITAEKAREPELHPAPAFGSSQREKLLYCESLGGV